jgi:N-acetyl-alpha-D-muramate 1-phosphate uridylyltransferase
LKAMVLAAGKGERMRPLTLTTPKPLLQAGGKTLIAHHLENLSANGITEIVINHAWLGEQIESALGDGKALGVNIAWSREGEPLETAGGIILALPLLQENTGSPSFICVNSDIWTDYPFGELPQVDGKEMLAWLVLVDNPEQHPEGDFVLQDGKVQEPAGNQRQESAYTFSGIAVYHPALFEGVLPGKQSIVPLLKQAMAKGKVGGEHYKGQWFDIGTPERLSQLEQLLT